jgi:alpha-galactosidase
MRRLILSLASLLLAIGAPAHAQTSRFDGAWLFDDTDPRPGVTMVEIATKKGVTSGTVTTLWYGPMAIERMTVAGDTATFSMRNLNDREHPTRTWRAKLEGGKLRLLGQIWFSEIDELGRRGTAGDAAQRRFRLTTLPPLGKLAPDGMARTPPMGWSSWNKFAEHIDDKTVRAMADALVSTGLRDAGYTYVNIDDGWQGTRGPDGRIRPNAKFPDMKALTDYVHARGLKIGIYSSQGPRTCAGYEGSYGHVRQDAQSYADWGFDYLKYDLCSGEWFYDTADTVQRSYYEMGAALRATGRPILFSLCEYGRFDVGSWGRDVGGHLWRTTGDITDDWKGMTSIGFDRNGNPAYAGPGGWNDPDMLEIGNGGMTHDEYVTHMTLWAVSAAPLVMGHDLRETSPEGLALLTNRDVIAVDQDPRGVQGKRVRKDGDAEVWAKPLADGSVAVALFNRGDAARKIQLTPGDAGGTRVTEARDLWAGKQVGDPAAGFTVPSHGAVLLRVRAN